MTATGIEWTDFSANPVRYRDPATGRDVWACEKVSAGCRGCYAEAIAQRFGKGGPFNGGVTRGLEVRLDQAEAAKLIRSKKLAGKRVFVGDMTDVFGEWVPDAVLDGLFAVFALRPDVVWQVLTKRPERMAAYLTGAGIGGRVAVAMTDMLSDGRHLVRVEDAFAAQVQWAMRGGRSLQPVGLETWPLPTVWLGTSVENQQAADQRIPHLLKVPAAVRFLSCEPLIGPVELSNLSGWKTADAVHWWGKPILSAEAIGWVIAGGESGPNARPMHPLWSKSLRNQCQAAGVAFHFKQWGEYGPDQIGDVRFTPVPSGVPMDEPAPMFRVGKKAAGRLLDGRTWDQFPEVARG